MLCKSQIYYSAARPDVSGQVMIREHLLKPNNDVANTLGYVSTSVFSIHSIHAS